MVVDSLGYISNGLPEKALDLLERHPVPLNEVLYTIIYDACGASATERAMRLGTETLVRMPSTFRKNSRIMGSALHMLFTFGQVDQAEQLFGQMTNGDTSTYGVMMDGYNMNDAPHKSLIMFEEMKKKCVPLNEVIFLLLIKAASQISMAPISRTISDQIPSEYQRTLRVMNAIIHMWVCKG